MLRRILMFLALYCGTAVAALAEAAQAKGHVDANIRTVARAGPPPVA